MKHVNEGILERNDRRKRNVARLKRYSGIYLLMIVPVAWYLIFCYAPLYGLQIAWKDFRPLDGIWESPWVGWKWFKSIFSSPMLGRILWNTVYVFFLKLLICFPASIVFALLLNEVRSAKFKRFVQTVSYMPYFLNWVVIYGLWWVLANPLYGAIPKAFEAIGMNFVDPSRTPEHFIAFLVVSEVWKGIGWGSIIYLAAISGIDPGLYEAATLDGANRWQQMWNITLPSLYNLISIMLIFQVGRVLSGNFDQIYIFSGAAGASGASSMVSANTALLRISENFDVYLYNSAMMADYSLPTAVGLMKNVVSVAFLLAANFIAGKLGRETVL